MLRIAPGANRWGCHGEGAAAGAGAGAGEGEEGRVNLSSHCLHGPIESNEIVCCFPEERVVFLTAGNRCSLPAVSCISFHRGRHLLFHANRSYSFGLPLPPAS